MNKTIGVFELGRVPDALVDSYADVALPGGTAIPSALASAAARSLDNTVDNTVVACWAATFFREHLALTTV